MSNESEKIWLAAYLYRTEPWEPLLLEAVKPFVQETLKVEGVDQYFFIRYWERGPHIRLRFKGDKKVLEEKVKPALVKHFEAYFKENPSQRTEPQWPENYPEEHKWFPNDSVQFIEYEPEVERYGGPEGIVISEKQFEYSSNAVIGVIEESEDWNYDRALGAAIQMHLGFAFALEMDFTEVSHFFKHIFDGWLHRAYYNYEQGVSKEELTKRKEITLQAFEDNFSKQGPMLIPYHKTVWEAFESGASFEQEWINEWLTGMRSIRDQIYAIHKHKQLIIPETFIAYPKLEVPIERQELWYVYGSYVHMINNRLGILNRDEAFLGYLIKESLHALESSNA